MSLRKILVVGLVGYALIKAFGTPEQRAAYGDNRRSPERRSASRIRQAGTREMKDPPRDWDDIDERVDESFPASDPPGKY